MAGAKLKPIPEGIPWLTVRIHLLTIAISGFEENPANHREMRCILCFQCTPHTTASHWQKRGKSIAERHCSSQTHLGNVDAKRDEDELERRRQQASIDTYTGSSSMDVDDFSVHQENHSRPDMSFSAAPSTNHFVPTNPIPEFERVEPPAPYDPETEKENIRFQFEQILIRELFSDDEDASETNVLETLRSLGREYSNLHHALHTLLISDPVDDDDESGNLSIGENLFLPAADTENHRDYAPYPNKLVCDLEAFSVDEGLIIILCR